MRPAAPARYRRTTIERLDLLRALPVPAVMVYRNLSRRPLRAALSIVGIGLAAAMMVVGTVFARRHQAAARDAVRARAASGRDADLPRARVVQRCSRGRTTAGRPLGRAVSAGSRPRAIRAPVAPGRRLGTTAGAPAESDHRHCRRRGPARRGRPGDVARPGRAAAPRIRRHRAAWRFSSGGDRCTR